MSTVVSADGTTLAYERLGPGAGGERAAGLRGLDAGRAAGSPPVIIVDGALCYRGSGPARSLAQRLAPHLTVYLYDRRGRGDSRDTAPYAPAREVEDLAALVEQAGGAAALVGFSAGGALALAAAATGIGVTRVAAYEVPFLVDDDPGPREELVPARTALAEGRRGDAVAAFLRHVGVPAPTVAALRLAPFWPRLERVAHTLPYDLAVVDGNRRGEPLRAEQWAGVTVPVLVLDGDQSLGWIRSANRQLAGVLPEATYRTLPGQSHNAAPDALAPVLLDFLRG